MSKIIITLSIICFLVFSCEAVKEDDKPLPFKRISNIDPLKDLELVDVKVSGGLVEKVTGRISKLENFECADCHDEPKESWSLEALKEDGSHDDILEMYKHADSETMDCMTCHSLNDRNNLHLLNGKKVSFDKSFKLCAQCHTNKFKDWKNGAHGKRLGFWKNDKVYRNCVDCHNPHFPASAYPKKKPVVEALLIREELKSLLSDGHHGESTEKHNKAEKSTKNSASGFQVKTFYQKKCAKCHGDQGQGIEGKSSRPPINDLGQMTNEELFKIIKDGYKGDLGKMPGFKKKASDDELKELADFVKSLNK